MEFHDLLRAFLDGELVFEVRVRPVGQRPHDTGSAPAAKRARRAQSRARSTVVYDGCPDTAVFLGGFNMGPVKRCTVSVVDPPSDAAVRPPTFADRVLELLRETPEPVSAGDLAEHFGTTPSTMRVILSRMHRRGYLTRHTDGRSVRWSVREVSQ